MTNRFEICSVARSKEAIQYLVSSQRFQDAGFDSACMWFIKDVCPYGPTPLPRSH